VGKTSEEGVERSREQPMVRSFIPPMEDVKYLICEKGDFNSLHGQGLIAGIVLPDS